MSRMYRPIAWLAVAALASGAGTAPAESPVTRLGRTVVQYRDADVRAVLSWRYANQTFEKEPWLLLEIAFAAEGKPVSLNREDVALLTPGGERLGLPGQRKLNEELRDVRWVLQKASVSRDPITGYFPRQDVEQRLPFFGVPGEQLVQDEISAGPLVLTRGDLFFQAPAGAWKAGRYTLVLKNKHLAADLPFTLPADDATRGSKPGDPKPVAW